MVLGWLARCWAAGQSAWRNLRQVLATIVLVVLFLIVAFSAWVGSVDPTGFGLLDQSGAALWNRLGPIVSLIFVLFKPIWDAAKGDGHLRHYVVSGYDKTDMKKMAEFMSGADRVMIYSGDFSYIYDHEPLYNILKDLSSRGNLTFISYKSKTVVKDSSDGARGQRDCIIDILESSAKIKYDVTGEAKYSIIYRQGEEVLLYRHRNESGDFITVLRANNGMAKRLIDIIRTLTETIFSKFP